MNTFYRFLRCAALMVIIMTWTMPAKAQHPFTLTTADDIANGTQHYYLIQSFDRTTFYAIPHSDAEDSKVSTTSIPNATMRWYFMDAGSDDDNQYYYIVSSTGRCLYRMNDDNDGIRIKKTYAELSSLSEGELSKYKFYLEQTGSDYFIHPKGASDLYLNKKGTNPNYANGYYIKASTYYDSPSVWNFVAVDDVTWPQPFTISTIADKHYYKFQNVTNTSFYLSNSEEWATVSSTGSHENIWYLLDAGTDATYSSCHYYYIVNAPTGNYLYYTGGTGDDVAKTIDYNSTEADKYRFLIVDAAYKPNNTSYSTCYTIIPKLRQTSFSGKDSFAPIAMSDGSHLLLKSDRGTSNYDSHWTFVESEFYTVDAPTITNNDGTITLSTITTGATIYYTTNGDTPDNTSTEYSAPFSLGDATVIKAIAYLGSDFSAVTTYNVPKFTTPIISVNSTSEVTITCNGATGIYYTTDGSIPTTSSTSYSEPFTVSTGTVVKAIATHPGYLNSDVATKYIQGDDYPRNYLTFKVLTAGTIAWKSVGTGMEKTISYRINGDLWTSITAGSDATITVNAGDVVEFKGSNTAYASDKSNYSGFDGGTATFNISGNIMSLTAGDDFANVTTLPGTWTFCSLFKQSNAVSAENLILPATTLTADCYRAMFSMCETLVTAPQLPATTLASECYWYMFECCAITTAPDLLAPTLVSKCYGHMFVGCSNLNYIKCLATNGINTTNLEKWVGKKNAETTIGVAATGTFIKDDNTTTWTTGVSGIPTEWDVNPLAKPVITCDDHYITITCATPGTSIKYRLNQTGDFSLYSDPIEFNSTTTVEAYSFKDNITSNTVIVTFEKYDNPYEESNRSLDSWTYGGNQVTLPYSVNAIDGHSSSYDKGTFNFETTINLRTVQPTYLWFQHADQSAAVYVDNNLVEKHWGGYNAFFVDISDFVHVGTNNIKVAVKNNEGNNLAPAAGDFNFNATLGKVKLFTSPVVPSMDYGYDGFHITSSVTAASATINVKTSIPVGASVVCTISDGTYYWTETQYSTGDEQTFTTTIQNPHLWNGTLDPHLYNVKIEIYKDNELYHKYERPYGFRYYEYVIDEPIGDENYTGFLLNGSPYLLRGVCMHDDLEGKANALNDDDYAQEFAIIQDLGCNFIRLAHYPHPKEVYDWCDRLGIIVQTEVPCVNKLHSTMPDDYYTHLETQYEDMVRQHFNHPCIVFWGLSNETTTDDKEFGKTKIEEYTSFIKGLDSERLVGYVMSHSWNDPSGYYNNPDVDWFGCNIYVGWYIDQNSNNPTTQLNTRLNNTLTQKSKPLAFSEYGCGGTPSCHSDDFMSTTTRGNNPRHDIEYQMWLHEGHIAAIKNFPQLLFTGQWQLFDIAVSSRNEGYTVCIDGENTSTDDNLRYLNNKGLVERDHKTKKDTYYLYKAWWNQTDKFVHICGKDYEKSTDRAIKCYTNDGSTLTLFVNDEQILTATVVDNIATFAATTFQPGDVIRVDGATSSDTFTFTNFSDKSVFTTDGDWDDPANWKGNAVPAGSSDIAVVANAIIPSGYIANANNVSLYYGSSLTIADGGQLIHNNEGVNATVQKEITAYTVQQTQGEIKTDGWYLIGYSSAANGAIADMDNLLEDEYDLYYYDEPTHYWRNYKNTANNFTVLEAAKGYLYANSQDVTLGLNGTLNAGNATVNVPLSYTDNIDLAGFNLVGNPFAHNVTSFTGSNVADEIYRMNSTRTDLIVDNIGDNNPLKPGEGFFVKATADNASITFNSGAKDEMTKTGRINLEISENDQLIDRLIVKREGEPLEKLMLNQNSTKIFATRNHQDWAVVPMEGNEMPVYFKAAKNGIYTITADAEDIKMGYLHLIDNMTGADIDLLRTPSYNFVAMTSDYASRFKLVFVCGDADDNETFAFINNGNIIITTDLEGATLQVIDVMGRVIVSREGDVSGNVSTKEMSPGTYVLRLIDGDKVRTQKIVIR